MERGGHTIYCKNYYCRSLQRKVSGAPAILNFRINLKAVIKVSIYLALGDSLTAGFGVGRACSFPAVYGHLMKECIPDLQVFNWGINGLTTCDLLELLRCKDNLRSLVSGAALITVTIGSNDLLHFGRRFPFCLRANELNAAMRTMCQALEQIGETLRRLNPTAVIKAAALYNPLPAGPLAKYACLIQPFINSANNVIIAWAKEFCFEVVYLDWALRGRERCLIGPDFVHPNAVGHQVMAEAFARGSGGA